MKSMYRLIPALLISLSSSQAFAQIREADVFFDERGRRILLDRETGEVVAIEPDRGGEEIPEQRIIRREFGRGEIVGRPYDMTNPADRERLMRDREMLLGRRDAPVREGRYPRYEEPVYAEPEEYSYPPVDGEDGDFGSPRYGYPEPGSPQRVPPSRDRDVTRAPLETAPNGTGSVIAPGDQAELPPTIEQDRGLSSEPMVPQMPGKGASEDIAKIQILLDRTGASPGVIDGRMGDNVNKAIAAYRELRGQALRTYDKAAIDEELAATGGPAFVEYTITAEDAAGPYVASVPADYSEKAKLDRMSFTSVSEALAERFHMDENYLKALNPGVSFNRAGVIIKVANVGKPVTAQVARIVADKPSKQVRAFDAAGKLVAAYPATIGSGDTPSPSGTHTVERIAFDPEYTYNPKVNFKQGNNDKVLRIPPGPNGPVGSIWIALSKPTYGIHGTPDPSKIGKTESHGCVRLTNWDAAELAKMVKKGVTVEFID